MYIKSLTRLFNYGRINMSSKEALKKHKKKEEGFKMIKDKLIKDSIQNMLWLERFDLSLNNIGDLKDLKFLLDDLIERKKD